MEAVWVWVWVSCYDRWSASQSVLQQSTHLGLTARSLLRVWQLRSCSCGAPSLTRGRVCPLYMLLALASAVFLGSESLGTWDHISLSHIWYFPFRRLLWLAGSWWRYSTPPPHGVDSEAVCETLWFLYKEVRQCMKSKQIAWNFVSCQCQTSLCLLEPNGAYISFTSLWYMLHKICSLS
jgi:hypothetical protein